MNLARIAVSVGCCWYYVGVCRSSVLTVRGTGLSTRRSSSVMRLASISWRWTGTAVTPAMLLWLTTAMQTTSSMEWCFLLQTTTTTSVVSTALHPHGGKVDGGTTSAAQVSSTEMTPLFGRLTVSSKTCKPVACWSNSTSKPADESPPHREH